ncbi:probable calcium-binding protein CML44 [Alnus glutinosa]|uniref:probable calcium-binding protein CML44 n=1 Tax=Alnus glutinosa TaxID=3517 RepID=UPI002D7744AE|nr:probable calcium-binding protein CML44 [Alnus glutinosa]
MYALYGNFEIMSLLNPNDLHQIFENLDKNGDGLVSLEELNWLLEKTSVKFSLGELESLTGKTRLDFNDFSLFYDSISKQNKSSNEDVEDQGDENHEESDLLNAFKVFDLNGDGFISCEELQNVLSRLELWDASSGRDCRTMIRVYDTNLDGQLDFEEFKNMMFLTIS